MNEPGIIGKADVLAQENINTMNLLTKPQNLASNIIDSGDDITPQF